MATNSHGHQAPCAPLSLPNCSVPLSLLPCPPQPQAPAPFLSEGKGKKQEMPLDFLEARWAIDPSTKWRRK